MVSAIESKAESKSKSTESKERTTNDWGGFGKAIASNIFHCFLLILLICSSIFYVHCPEKLLDMFFPTEWKAYFGDNENDYSVMDGGRKKRKSMKGGDGKCRNRVKFKTPGMPSGPKHVQSFKEMIMETMGLDGNLHSGIYKLYDKNKEGSFKNWLAEVTARTYMLIREGWKKIYGFGGFKALPDWAFILVAPIMAIGCVIVGVVAGFLAPFWYSYTTGYGVWAILYAFVLVTPFILGAWTSHFWAHILYAFMGLMAAPLTHYKEIAEIAKCNKNAFGLLFGALVVGSCFDYLLPSVGYSAMIAWIIMFIRAIMSK